MFDGTEVDVKIEGNCLVLKILKIFVYWLKNSISFYKVKWQNSLKAELTDSLCKFPGCSLFSRIGIG